MTVAQTIPTQQSVVREVAFRSKGLAEGVLSVAGFTGREEISKSYRFEIDLLSNDPDLDLSGPIEADASLVLSTEYGARSIHGVLSEFELCGESESNQVGHYRYRAVLVPRLWLLGLSKESRIFQNLTVPEVVDARLAQAEIAASERSVRLETSYAPREYVVQFGESALNFVDRLLEHEGIHYHFDQSGDREKIVFGDANGVFGDLAESSHVEYVGESHDRSGVRALSCRRTRQPRQVVLRDYDESAAHVPLRGNAIVDEAGHGSIFEDGPNLRAPEAAADLARVRAEELQLGSEQFKGQGTHPLFRAGTCFNHEGHFRRDFNAEFLLTSVEHHCAVEEGSIQYSNQFSAIPAVVPFRPARVTLKPRLHGSMRAEVDASGPGEAAEADALGRYRLIMPFDESGAGEGRATLPVRMAQPYGGADRGMHFPLPKGAEVVWTCIDGDPDRPIITGTVPNANHPSVAIKHPGRATIQAPSGAMLEFSGDRAAPNSGAALDWPKAGQSGEVLAEPRHLSDEVTHQSNTEGAGSNDTFFRVYVPHSDQKVSYLRVGEAPSDGNTYYDEKTARDDLELNEHKACPDLTSGDPKDWGTAGVFDFTERNRTVITGGNKEEIVFGKQKLTIKKGGLGLFDAEPIYGVNFFEDWDGHWRKREWGFTRSDTYFYGDKEDFFAGFTFSGMVGVAASLYIGGKIDIGVAATLSIGASADLGFNASWSYHATAGSDFNVAKSVSQKAREKVDLRVKKNPSHGNVLKGVIAGTAGAMMVAGGVGAAISGFESGIRDLDDGGGWGDTDIGLVTGGLLAAYAGANIAGLAYLATVQGENVIPPDSQVLLKDDSIHLTVGTMPGGLRIGMMGNNIAIRSKKKILLYGDVVVSGDLTVSGAISGDTVSNASGATIADAKAKADLAAATADLAADTALDNAFDIIALVDDAKDVLEIGGTG